MFGSLLRQARASVEASVTYLLERVIVAVPFLVAAGFGTAALTLHLTKSYGANIAMLTMAGGFAMLGLVAMGVVNAVSPSESETDVAFATGSSDEGASGSTADQAGETFSNSDVLMAGLSALAPVAMTHGVRLAVRHLPLLAAIGLAAYVVSRQPNSGETSNTSTRAPTA